MEGVLCVHVDLYMYMCVCVCAHACAYMHAHARHACVISAMFVISVML